MQLQIPRRIGRRVQRSRKGEQCATYYRLQMVGNGACENCFGREISTEIEISRDEAEVLTEKGSEVEISRAKCSGVETSRE